MIFDEYSSASDVWSFGIVLYEIWSGGEKPYQYLNNSQVNNKTTIIIIMYFYKHSIDIMYSFSMPLICRIYNTLQYNLNYVLILHYCC